MICADGRLGCHEFAPYNAIHVGAAVEIVPDSLLQQLSSDGGLLVIPVGPYGEQVIKKITR
jgi:protein-L-isoaspartate(D-aspartate) O-methyltransferase